MKQRGHVLFVVMGRNAGH